MALRIGDTMILTFSDTSLLGAGVAHADGMAVFCRGAVGGDTAEVRIAEVTRRYANAELLRLITPSADRCAADCAQFGRCGGCTFRHITYGAEASLKENAVRAALRRFDGIAWEPIFTASPEGYRNKAVFHLDAQYRPGFCGAATNDICLIPNGGCALLPPLLNEIAAESAAILASGPAALPFRAIAVRMSTADTFTAALHAEQASTSVRDAAARWADAISAKYPGVQGLFLAIGMPEDRDVRYTRLSGADALTDRFLSLELQISPAAFYQVNHTVAEALCTAIADYAALSSGESAADLYCGTGTIGLTLAKLSPQAQVTGIEIVPAAVRNAKTNAARNQLTNITFRTGDSATAERDGLHFDCIVIDPPRKGCSPEMLAALTRLAPARIVYVSCNPATLARDAAALADAGWRITRARPFDMFPRTGHCETLTLFTR